MNLANYPDLESSLIKYNSYTPATRPKCCRPDQFPGLFEFLYALFSVIESIGKKTIGLLCDVLQYLTPLSCKKNIKGNPKKLNLLGCVVKALLGPLFGKLGILAVC